MSFLLVFLLVSACGQVSTSYHFPIRHMYSFVGTNQDALMQRIVVHNRTQEVYVSARNSLYHFDSNLGLKARVSTGPELDNTLCLHPSHQCKEKLAQTDNDNKVLLIYYNVIQDMLLSCGTLYQGICQVRPLEDITRSSWVGPFDRSVGFVAGRESAVGFFAPGPSSFMSLYAASTYDGRTMEYSPVSVSSRVLSLRDNKFQFDYSQHSDTEFTGVEFDRDKFKKLYKVDYIAGFSHGYFSYFLTVQRVSPESVAIHTRLARICHTDPSFFSYTEVALKCSYGRQGEYNMASAATLGPASSQLKLEDSAADAILYVAFLRTVSEHGKLVDRAKGSVVCSYPMSQVVRHFTNATRDCFHAEPRTHLLKHVTGVDLKCSLHEDVEVEDSFCGSSFNSYIEGRDAIPGRMRTHLIPYVTSLAITLQRGKTVAVMGSERGSVIKVVLGPTDDKSLYSINIANETEGQSSSKVIQRQNAFDASHDNIYFLTGHKVVKFPIASCSIYRECVGCLRTTDPLECGWCGTYCAHLEECETPDLFSTNSCRPVIYNVYPLSGPTKGGTHITVFGDNFGISLIGEFNSGIHIFVAGEKCKIVQWKYEYIECETSAVSMPKSGPILINISDDSWLSRKFILNGTALSSQNFSYAVPKMYGIQPSYGPVSGGTNITIYGEKLNIGAKHNITVNRVPCREFRVFETLSWCITDRFPDGSMNNSRGPVELEIDNAIIKVEVHPKISLHLFFEFQYRPDPQIKSIYPQVTSLSGATNLTIFGSHLDSVTHAKMVVTVTSSLTDQKLEFDQPCSKIFENGTRMICSTPPLNIAVLPPPTARSPLVTHVAFIMDGVRNLRDLPLHDRNLSQLLYYPDPEFFPFNETDGVKQLSAEDSLLKIEGKNLNLSHIISDFKVLIDWDKICSVTSISEDKLYCVLPPMSADSSDNLTRHTVDVIVGPLTFHLGYVKLVDFQVDVLLLCLISIAIGLLLVLLCGVIYMRDSLCRWARKRKMRHPEYIAAYTTEDQGNADANDHQVTQPGDTEAIALTIASPVRTMCMTFQQQETVNFLLPEIYIISKKDLILGDVIGQGHFGIVYRGNLKKEEEIAVAVKTLHGIQDVEAFLREADTMKDFHHHNVLELIGVCCEPNSLPMVITPYMKNGDLVSYISSEKNNPTVRDLLEYSFQIAAGMTYLAEIKFVHRDLAARNCLLDDDGTVRVADFGLSRDICEQDYCSSNIQAKLPLKWMAPESLLNFTFNTKTDVWSYGVVLWELFTRGVTPYPELKGWDILEHLKSGKRMAQPSYCPDLLYDIMQRCWLDDCEMRPTFTDLKKQVHGVISSMEQRLEQQTVGLDITYVNCSQLKT